MTSKVLDFLQSLSATINVGPEAAEETLLMIANEADELLSELRAKLTEKTHLDALRAQTEKALHDGVRVIDVLANLLTAHDATVFYSYGIEPRDQSICDAILPLTQAHAHRIARSTRELVVAVSTLLISRGIPSAVKHQGTSDGHSSSN